MIIYVGKNFWEYVLQLLFTKSEEFGNHSGLDILKGEVKKFKFNNEKLPVPQMNSNK